MSSRVFSIKEHTLPTSYIREYPHAIADSQEEDLHLAIKQYTPLDNKGHEPGAITIIGGHANGFPKELYEPLWEEVYKGLKAAGIRVSSIWIADVATQGQSSVLNEKQLGNDPSWFDHPRDLFLMVNHFRKQMPRPLVGIGHSMGGQNLVQLSLMHPRLFTTLILIDPVIARGSGPGNWLPAQASSRRRDRWPSRTAAAQSFGKSKFYQTWDPRVLDLWIRYGLRNLPTAIYPSATVASKTPPVISAAAGTVVASPEPETEQEVTLTTTKHQEVFSFIRPNFPSAEFPNPGQDPNPLTHPDVDLDAEARNATPFYRAEPRIVFNNLPHLRPSVLYVFGKKSDLSVALARADKMAMTGTGVGGSGGVKKGRVREVMLDAGHLIPMEKVEETGKECVEWLVPELARWKENEERLRQEWEMVPREKKSSMSDEFVRVIQGDWIKQATGGKSKL